MASTRADIPPEAPALLTIDLAALRKNYRKIKALANNAVCGAVVKADAYGVGARRAVEVLADEGCDTFFIATLDEARLVRHVAPQSTLYALGGLLPGTEALCAEIDLRPILGSLDEIEDWAAFARERGERLPAALHIDTGMNRLGLRAVDLEKLTNPPSPLEDFDVSLVMSHLACSDEPDNPRNETQRQAFEALRAMLEAAPASLANSGGVFLGPAFHYDVVRPGIALYGGRATKSGREAMDPVVHLDGRILQIKQAEPGETVGYGATHMLKRATRIAIVAAGYADGYIRALSSSDARDGAVVYIGEHEAPILGRVSMDLIAVDVTGLPQELAVRGAFVELLGHHVSVDDLAGIAGTIGYEVLTSLGQRYHRIYVDE
jgi:alanine racemase